MKDKTGKSLCCEIPFFQVHSEYTPFVGDEFNKYKILIIGESHYIDQRSEDSDNFEIDYFFQNWFNGNCADLNAKYSDWFNTQKVIKNYIHGYRTRGHLIFTNLVKAFSEIILKEKIANVSLKSSQKMEYFSFMNFFQMPSIYNGEKFWCSLSKSAKNINRPELANELWETVVNESVRIVDKVIDCLKPALVVFVSESAYNAYSSNKGSRHLCGVKHCDHPGCSWWNRVKKGGTLTGKERFMKILADTFES